MKILQFFRAILECRKGATAVEYGLIVSLLVLAIMTSLNSFAGQAIAMWGRIATAISSAN